jgi:aryl-alcohol dehydrogenase-like predicted oxidoreductase
VQYRRLGRTELQVSALGLGSGGRSRLGQTDGSGQAEIDAIVERALALGVNVIDTAPAYARSEELLGGALAGVDRGSYVLCTKFNPVVDEVVQPIGALRASLETSLSRLRADQVDVLYLHGVHPDWLDAVTERFLPELEQARSDGLVKFIGITESFQYDYEHQTLRKAIPLGAFDVVMVGHNLLSPSPADHVFPMAADGDVGVVIMCAVRGVLLDPERVRAVVREWKDEGLLPTASVPDEDPLGSVLQQYANDVTSAAYRFAADHSAVGTVLTGTGNVGHLEKNAAAIAEGPLPHDIVEKLYQVFGPVSRSAAY